MQELQQALASDPEYLQASRNLAEIDEELSALRARERKYYDERTEVVLDGSSPGAQMARRGRELNERRKTEQRRRREARAAIQRSFGETATRRYQALVRDYTQAAVKTLEAAEALEEFERALPGELRDYGLGESVPRRIAFTSVSSSLALLGLLRTALRIGAIRPAEVPKSLRNHI